MADIIKQMAMLNSVILIADNRIPRLFSEVTASILNPKHESQSKLAGRNKLPIPNPPPPPQRQHVARTSFLTPADDVIQVEEFSDKNEEGKLSNRFYKDKDGFCIGFPAVSDLIKGWLQVGTALRAVPIVKKTRIFVSRLDPEETVDSMKEYVKGLIGEDCDVEKLNSRFPCYSSFVITCSKCHENTLLDPDCKKQYE